MLMVIVILPLLLIFSRQFVFITRDNDIDHTDDIR